MYASTFLHNRFLKSFPSIHQVRLKCVVDAVDSVLHCQHLQLTAIGRGLNNNVADKHSIKRIDRLLGNRQLNVERFDFYKWVATQTLITKKHPVILVDYSDVNPLQTHFIIRAAVSAHGRALTVYEEVHEQLNNPILLRGFVKALSLLLPKNCRPIIVTDAGFRGTWRDMITERGWFYVMRQRNNELAHFPGKKWHPCKDLYHLARRAPRCLGEIVINRNSPCHTQAYVYAEPSKKRIARTLKGKKKRSSHSKKHAAREREPWLLLSNLPLTYNSADRVVKLYKQRMQIEELFRDLKSHRTGLRFRGTQCRQRIRLEALLLLAALANFIVWIMGLWSINRRLHHGMQANTIRHRNVLSVITVGFRLIAQKIIMSSSEFWRSKELLQNEIQNVAVF